VKLRPDRHRNDGGEILAAVKPMIVIE